MPPEGTYRDRHGTLARVAMGRCGVRWVLCSPDENAAAYGEVVWSWRRDPGATSAGAIPPATGARKAASPGRARISRKTIARGKPGCLGCTCQIRVHSLCTFRTRCCGRSRRPAFPAPSVQEGANEFAKLRRNCVVRVKMHVYPRIASEAKQSSFAAAKKVGLLRRFRSSQ